MADLAMGQIRSTGRISSTAQKHGTFCD